MSVGGYWNLLREHRFRIHPSRYPMTALVGGCAVFNSTMNRLQKVFYQQHLNRINLGRPPVFIIGHWRSGTTLMHELISQDERFAYPSNFEAFVPEHFLLTRHVMYPLINMLMPSKRPMDAMTMNAASPQEDDFALLAYGAPTPYRRVAFPGESDNDRAHLNSDAVDEGRLEGVRKSLDHFYRSLTLRYRGRQLVLKSPPHTGRMAHLAKWFPGAKFVHLSRHPHKLVSSTMRLWRVIDEIQSFQKVRYDDAWLRDYVFDCQRKMYDAYLTHRDSMPSNQLIEIRFEDLVADPAATMERVYGQLELGDFEVARSQIESYFADRKDHRLNKSSMSDELRQQIDQNYARYSQAFGYENA